MEVSSSSSSVAAVAAVAAAPSSDLGKLFVGGIVEGMKEEEIRDHFAKFGELKEVVLVKDRVTGNCRGFGFVQLSDPDAAEAALKEEDHSVGGRKIEVKRARPRDVQRRSYQSPQHQYPFYNQHENTAVSNNAANSHFNSGNPTKSKKIFVGGLPSTINERDFRSYFEKFGRITDVVIMYDSTTHRPRGFGFITFDSEEAVDSVMQSNYHQLSNKHVEVKVAVPKDGNNHSISNSYNGSSYNSSMGRGRGFVGDQQGWHFPSYSPRNGFYPAYAPAVSEFYYGTTVYGGGYPVNGYGRMGYGATFLSPRVPFSGPGVRRSPMPYCNAAMYPGYLNAGFGGYMAGNGGYHGVACSANGRLNQSGDDVGTEDNIGTTDVGNVKLDAQQSS
ncbi:RNA-binding protein Musashi-like protein 2-like [Iris pallida]|uniref:RNA-binding protein Musashi-like protein 2-like n=1 Tax=Iris pallida TaxID=29817 RepID=A0AAX6I231_IRIPA|nr:RNA-binding protein Musashi-like protein 2-like [Iris pallida]